MSVARAASKALCVLSALLLCTCAKAPSTTPATGAAPAMAKGQPPSAARPLAFGWKIPCRVSMDERSEKDERSAHVTYTLTARPGENDNLDVFLEDFRFLEFNGADMTTPEQQARIAPALALATFMPPLLVTRDGQYAGIRGIDEAVKRLLDARPFRDPKVKAGVEKLMLSPEMLATLEEKTGEYWMLWVGAWVGLSLAPGETSERDEMVEVAARRLPVHLRYQHHGAGKEGTIRLSLTSTSEGDAAAESMTGFVRWMLQQSLTPEQAKRSKDMRVDSFRRVIRMEVETDPTNLRPRRARYEMVAEIGIEGRSMKKREVREDLFDWTHAEGCR